MDAQSEELQFLSCLLNMKLKQFLLLAVFVTPVRLADCDASRAIGFDWRQRGRVLQWLVFSGVAVQCF